MISGAGRPSNPPHAGSYNSVPNTQVKPMSSISKMLFTIADRFFYEPLDRYAVNHDAFFDPVQKMLPADWKLDRHGMWFNVTPPEYKLPIQGWKIHVSATQANALTLLERVVPVLVKRNLPFKFALDPLVLSIITGKGWSSAGAGKFITVYFENQEQFVSAAEELHCATKGLEGPFVVSDRRYGDSKVIYYRYGGLSYKEVMTARGERTLVIFAPDGRAVPDERLSRFVLPEWVTDPFPGPHAASPGESPGALKNNRYKIRSPLARSSCGGVYLAEDTLTQTQVVIKQARPLLNFTPSGDDAVRLLKREYRLLKKVEESEIAPRLLDFFEEDDQAYLVEEYIANSTTLRFYCGPRTVVLLTRPTRAKVEAFWSEYKRICLRVAELLQALHNDGILFMDFSHNNVLISNDGERLKLIDLEGAFEMASDGPSHLLTPGFVSVSDLNAAPAFSHDYFAFGATMLSYIMPVNAMMLLDPDAPARFLKSITADFGLPPELEPLITRLLHSDSALRPSLVEVSNELEKMNVHSDPAYRPENDTAEAAQKSIQGVVEHILNVTSYDRTDRLFPSDPKIFVTNPLSIAFGACGVAWALKKITGDVPSRVTEWMLQQPVNADLYPPGLYLGMAGIAWVFKELGLQQEAEELMRMSWEHPALTEAPDIFYGLAGWGIAQLRFFFDTSNEEYLAQAKRAGDLLLASAKEENGRCYWSQSGNAVTLGFAHGSSGISVFLLYLYLATGEERYLNMGKRALDFDIAAAIPNAEGAISWPVRRVPGAPGVPYFRYGSAGVGLALVRYYRALGLPQYREILEKMFPDTCRKYGIYPGRFIGLAGIGEFLLDLGEIEPFAAKCHEALQRNIAGTLLFQVDTENGVAFPGYELYRFSCDFATGSAGIALSLHRYLTRRTSDFFLDELMAGATTKLKTLFPEPSPQLLE